MYDDCMDVSSTKCDEYLPPTGKLSKLKAYRCVITSTVKWEEPGPTALTVYEVFGDQSPGPWECHRKFGHVSARAINLHSGFCLTTFCVDSTEFDREKGSEPSLSLHG